MGIANDSEQGKTKVGKGSKNSKPENNTRGMGTVQGSSSTVWVLKGTNARKNSVESTGSANERRYSPENLDGGIVSQLRKDVEEQLAFHEQQVEKLKARLEELDSLTEEQNE
ncbi:hypothetical protein NIES4075_73070 [Tolypothrix sp. NIES-4075]|uniref:hypothetical protein n=1 Tax=Tolypothrix sp. NIES-4075 TaxID=2005459 RepID=UPI000B5CBA90|nr:hypothetical protein [Tolypothrix sp. NIES-4075]GAX46286.1 hypothetical protein NIES4075_73070 [Tolypothrix sp. NIES-4075]